MKTVRLGTGLALTVCLSGSWLLAQQITITIDRIEPNQIISGFVRGLQPPEVANYKVIVYVHTDQWYIHPYAGQGEGLSWAPIRPNGVWQIETVQRRFRADKMAALVVKKTYPEPPKLENLQSIPSAAMVIRDLRGTPDFGKL